MDIAPTEDTPGASEVAREIPASVNPFSIFSQVPSTTSSSRRLPSPGASGNPVTRPVQSSLWVPDDMASGCCLCGKEFNVVRRRHHCRTCGRVCCDACSSKRINDKRTCASCWDRIGRKLSGLSRSISGKEETATRERDRKSVLFELLEDERFNRRFVVEGGRSVSYSVAGVPDGLPVFLFLGLDSHRYTAVLFEDVARRQGLQLICIDRPGRGKSDPLPPPPQLEGKGQAGDVREAMSRAIEASVVDTIKQMCVKLRFDKAGLLGQSLGSLFALGCAKDEGLKDVLGDTTVCLVSPWVPLAAPGSNGWLQTTSSIPALASTAGIIGGEVTKHVGDMEHGSSGASDKERVYLQAPYTQDLFKHLSVLKEGKEAVKNELWIALRNYGEEAAKKGLEAILHAVHIWHGKADILIPYDAMRWLEQQLPSCSTTVVAEATHALMYDKDEMEKVFACLHKSISDARSTARHTARRIGNQLVSIFAHGDHSSKSPGSTSTAKDAKKGSTGTEKDDDREGVPSGAASTTTSGRPKLTDVLKTLSSSKKLVESEVPSAGTPSAYESVVGSVSGHGSSGHGRSWHGQGSDHGQGGSSSRHGSELPPRCIPEESGAPVSGEGSGMFVGFRKIGHAMSEAFGSEHGSVGSSHGGAEGRNEAMPPPPRPPLSKRASTGNLGGRGVDPTYPSEEEGGARSGSVTEGLMRKFDRAMSSISLGSNGSGHGSVQGSAHGSIQGSAHGNGGGGGAVAGGAVGASRRPSGGLLPWSRLDDREAEEVDVARNENGQGTPWALSAIGVGTPRNVSSAASLGTPRAVSTANLAPPRNLRAFTSDGFRRGWRSLSSVTVGTPRALSSAAARCSQSFFGAGASSGEMSLPPPGSNAAGYEAAMANWPAGKVPGNPAWDEWSVEKKLFAHIVTACCLALIVATW